LTILSVQIVAMASQREDVYATLLLNDSYLPGALVLAHSLRDAGTTKKLAVLVTTDGISAESMLELEKIFDYLIPVQRIANETPANLHLMGRADLHSTFTKVALWKQTQFRRIVYVDADMVALRAPDELFDIPQPFSAAPDIGWPDIFNTGLMVLDPNMGDYYALMAMAQRGISFDGADQGLLNMHFKNTFNRISFSYNVTPSAHYQYLPAYRHFQASISMAHFIGQNKPWHEGREANQGSTPYDEMVGRWWSVYDKHYRESSSESSDVAPIVQYHTKGEFQTAPPKPEQKEKEHERENKSEKYHPIADEPPREPPKDSPKDIPHTPQHSHCDTIEHGENVESVKVEEEAPKVAEKEKPEGIEAYVYPVQNTVGKEPEKEPHYYAWDARKAPPPTDSKPEAHNFPSTQYTMSSDPTPFIAPERYPDPPKGMYYEVPKTPTYQKPAPIFPWEKTAPKPTRVFPEDGAFDFEPTEFPGASSPGTATVDDDEKPAVTPSTPTIRVAPADPWQTFTSKNAWDDIPEIERYIGNLQKNRKGNIQVLQGYGSGIEQLSSPGARRHSMKLTDFPTEMERPSLPVTPAPIRRPTFWGGERDDAGELPAAEGVPSQEDWDPVARLEQLARRQSDVLASKLGKDGGPAREIPMRPLPYGSEGVISPTYVPQTAHDKSHATPRTMIAEPAYHGASAAWEKGETYPTFETPMPPSEEEKDILDN